MVVASQAQPRRRDWKALQVRLDHDLYEWLRAKSFFERRSMNVLVLDALMRTRAGEAPHEAWRNHDTAH
jgi:hypothetical protein